MKKRFAILSLVAIFFSVVAVSAQTAKPSVKAEATTKTCCKRKSEAECIKMTAAEKTACKKDSTKACCTKKSANN